MKPLRKLYSFRAGSLLESVIALTIISVCLYIAAMVYAAVFTTKTSVRYYKEQNHINEVFFLLQLQQDSLPLPNENKCLIEIEKFEGVNKALVKYKDSSDVEWREKVFYINE